MSKTFYQINTMSKKAVGELFSTVNTLYIIYTIFVFTINTSHCISLTTEKDKPPLADERKQ